MIFGDPTDFAIEAGVEPDLRPPSAVWGYMCIWCRGMPLGGLDERRCGLSDAYLSFRRLIAHLDDLWAPELVGLDDSAAFNFLDGLLYGYHGHVELLDDRSDEQVHADEVAWHRFDFLTNWGEQFNGHKAFLLCPPGDRIRVLARELPAHLGRGVEVSRSAFLAASEGFARWFEEQESRLRGEKAM